MFEQLVEVAMRYRKQVLGYDKKRLNGFETRSETRMDIIWKSKHGGVKVSGKTQEAVDKGVALIEGFVAQKEEKDRDKSQDLYKDWPTALVQVPPKLHSGIIGPRGAHARELQLMTGARFRLDEANGVVKVQAPDDGTLNEAVPLLMRYVALLEKNYLSVPSDLKRDPATDAAEAAEFTHVASFTLKEDVHMRTILGAKGVNIKQFQALEGIKVSVVHGARFWQKFTFEEAIGSHACSLQANMRVTKGIPLGCSTFLTSSHCKLRPNTEGATNGCLSSTESRKKCWKKRVICSTRLR
jgi:hypothetical protein